MMRDRPRVDEPRWRQGARGARRARDQCRDLLAAFSVGVAACGSSSSKTTSTTSEEEVPVDVRSEPESRRPGQDPVALGHLRSGRQHGGVDRHDRAATVGPPLSAGLAISARRCCKCAGVADRDLRVWLHRPGQQARGHDLSLARLPRRHHRQPRIDVCQPRNCFLNHCTSHLQEERP
jgi:hypothetical protein